MIDKIIIYNFASKHTENMKYSIVTINFNNQDGLHKTIENVVTQTFKDFEYIIIDGGSTDGSVEIIKKYKDKITYWVSEPDKGIYNAMNKGIEKASGDWIIFMNSGDIFANDNILSLVNSCEVPLNTAVIYGDSFEGNADKNYKYQDAIPFWESRDYLHHKGFCHQSSFTRTELAKKYLFDEHFKIAADYKMFYDFYKDGLSFYYIPLAISIFDIGGTCKQNPKIAFKEDAIILGKYGTIKYYYYYMKKFYYYRIEWAIKSRICNLLK